MRRLQSGTGATTSRENDKCAQLERAAQEEWEQSCTELLARYDDLQPRLENLPFRGILAATLSPKLSACFLGSSWKTLASALGMSDTELQAVEERGERMSVAPLLLALQEPYPILGSITLGRLVQALRDLGRLDVLHRLEEPLATACLSVEPSLDSGLDSGLSSLQELGSGQLCLPEPKKCYSLLDTYLPQDGVSVLISHLPQDELLAQELAQRLQGEHGCRVIVEGQLAPPRHVDPLFLSDLVSKVDAIVPLVTPAYLAHHRDVRNTGQLEAAESPYEVYWLLQHRLVANAFSCHMLFPARAPGVEFAHVRAHHIFAKARALWNELPQLARLIRECKRLKT